MDKKIFKLKKDKRYAPFPLVDGNEIFRNGIFRINITKIMEHIECGVIKPIKSAEDKGTVGINVQKWYRSHSWHGLINEDHLPNVDITKPVIQVEFNPGMYKIIDGHHRMALAYRKGVATVESYKLNIKQWLPYFADVRGYESFVDYWNSKVD